MISSQKWILVTLITMGTGLALLVWIYFAFKLSKKPAEVIDFSHFKETKKIKYIKDGDAA